MEFFETLHIETTKEIANDDISEDLASILNKNGYQIIGLIGRTEIIKKHKKRSDDAHEAFEVHYEKIKNAW